MKSPLCASEDVLSSSMQSPLAPVVTPDTRLDFAGKSKMEKSPEGEDVWDIWPYCWVTAGHDVVTERFHSFHARLNRWLLAHHNRRVLRRHRTQLQGWSCEAGARIVK